MATVPFAKKALAAADLAFYGHQVDVVSSTIAEFQGLYNKTAPVHVAHDVKDVVHFINNESRATAAAWAHSKPRGVPLVTCMPARWITMRTWPLSDRVNCGR